MTAEQLVFQVQQLPAAGGEVTASGQPHRAAAGRPVEGLGHRCPPVDHDRLLALVGDRETTDVVAVVAPVRLLGRVQVDAAEAQRRIAQLQLRQPVDDRVEDDLALEPGLLGPAPADLDHVLQPRRRRPGRLQTGVRVVDVGLLGLEVGMEHQLEACLSADLVRCAPRADSLDAKGMKQHRVR